MKPALVNKPRPKRIAAVRASEVLAIMAYDLNMEDAEWWDKDELDGNYSQEPAMSSLTNNIIPVQKTVDIEWTDDIL